ncbi:MAG: selenium-dependent molybdenum cofactor biosynthesis protein YqeB [Ruthenibacterium sp.]
MLVLIKGAGDLASGVALRLFRSHIPVVMTEIAAPTTVRCSVAFSGAVTNGTAVVEGVCAKLATGIAAIHTCLVQGVIPVVIDPDAAVRAALRPDVLVDAILAKKNLGTRLTDAPCVIALGPGFTAGIDCHAVIETKRGHTLGRVIYAGSAIANTGIPGEIAGHSADRIIRACADGVFTPLCKIGTIVQKGDAVACVGKEMILAQLDGVVRGMLPAGVVVTRGMKSGDIDPRGIVSSCETVSDKALAIGGGVLEALLHFTNESNERILP